MSDFPNTEDQENWSVFLFDCPKERIGELIVRLFEKAKQILPNSLPNYTMRHWTDSFIKISFRVLRDKNRKRVVKRLETTVVKLLTKQNIEPIVNPKGDDAKVSGWSKAPLPKCKAYSKLSEFVVSLAEENLFGLENRNEMRHLAINMLFMREATEHAEDYVPFVDLITNKVPLQPYPIRIKLRKNGDG